MESIATQRSIERKRIIGLSIESSFRLFIMRPPFFPRLSDGRCGARISPDLLLGGFDSAFSYPLKQYGLLHLHTVNPADKCSSAPALS
jgi:hypothetical protein